MAQKFERRFEKSLYYFCLKFSKNLYFTKNSLYEKSLLLKEPASGPVKCKQSKTGNMSVITI